MLATPDSFRLNQNPLGASSLPQAPITIAHSPSPEMAFDGSGEVALSSTHVDSRAISFVLTESRTLIWASLQCFRVANVQATGRQAQVCLRPLIYYGQIRASRPPPLQHRVPIRAGVESLYATRRSRRSFQIAPGPFQSQVERFLELTEVSFCRNRPFKPHSSWTYA